MAGNHFEWCWDRFGDYTSDPQTDPRGPNVGVHRVFRGGSWYDNAKNCEIANRRAFTPETVYNRVGFRLVLPRPARPWLELESKNITVDSHPRWIRAGGFLGHRHRRMGCKSPCPLGRHFWDAPQHHGDGRGG